MLFKNYTHFHPHLFFYAHIFSSSHFQTKDDVFYLNVYTYLGRLGTGT